MSNCTCRPFAQDPECPAHRMSIYKIVSGWLADMQRDPGDETDHDEGEE